MIAFKSTKRENPKIGMLPFFALTEKHIQQRHLLKRAYLNLNAL